VLAVDADEIEEAYRWSLDVVVALDADIDETGGFDFNLPIVIGISFCIGVPNFM